VSRTEAAAKPEAANLEIELQQMRELLESQAKQLETQNTLLKAQQQRVEALEEQLKTVSGPTENVAATIGTPPAASNSGSLGSSPVNATAAVSNTPAQEQKAAEPASLTFKGITLTPGGFMAAETVWRAKALGSDINTPFNSIPVPGSSQSQLSEFFGSGRQSRISMLAEGKLASVKIGGYYETDFLSSGVTSNNNQSNSYTLRQRQFFAQAALDSGWTFTGGQMWSLVTETKKGLDNRTEATPMTIDAAYNVGFSWARQYGFRVTRNFGNKFWLGFSAENPQTTNLGVHGTLTATTLLGSAGTTGGLYDNQSNYAFNSAPDLIFKAALEPGWGHYEIFGVVSRFRNRIFPCGAIAATATCSANGSTGPSAAGAFNDAREGGGVGANLRIPLFAKRADFGIHVLGGSGIGRYGSAGLSEVTLRPDATEALIRSYQALGTLELHPTSKLDIYMNVGGEYAARTWYATGATTAVGYGSPLFNNSGCYTEPPAGSGGFTPGTVANCTADTRNIIEGTFGFWHRIYSGPKGRIQWGPQISYLVRNTWSGTAAANGVNAPHMDEPMFLTSFRYYLP
jgi:hypothetical protein